MSADAQAALAALRQQADGDAAHRACSARHVAHLCGWTIPGRPRRTHPWDERRAQKALNDLLWLGLAVKSPGGTRGPTWRA